MTDRMMATSAPIATAPATASATTLLRITAAHAAAMNAR
jgi:hypothetical protein